MFGGPDARSALIRNWSRNETGSSPLPRPDLPVTADDVFDSRNKVVQVDFRLYVLGIAPLLVGPNHGR